jgi:hypothetical protein
MNSAMVASTRGAVELAGGDPRNALPFLRQGFARWHDLDAPYETARARLLVAEACCALGDEDSAALEFEAAGRSSPARSGGPGRAALRLAEAVPGRRIRNAMAP